MKQTKKWTVAALVVAVALGAMASSAFAAVANTSQKGSLMIFPLIDVREGSFTLIRMANDSNVGVTVKCYYVNETKARVDFMFRLTPHQPTAFDAGSGTVLGGVVGLDRVQAFPTDVDQPAITNANPFLGELICFAVDTGGSQQISHNHLSGTATITNNPAIFGVPNPVPAAYEYNSWNFAAQGVARGTAVGVGGALQLTGETGAYNACPVYNILHFSPTSTGPGPVPPFPADTTVSVTHRLGVSTCLQDLREEYILNFVNLRFHVWNFNEVKFTGAREECADSTSHFLVDRISDTPANFTANRLGLTSFGTAYAQVQAVPVAANSCFGRTHTGIATGIVSVEARVIAAPQIATLPDSGQEVPLHGTTLNSPNTAHGTPGLILWDTQGGDVERAR